MSKLFKFSVTTISAVTAVGFTGWLRHKSNTSFEVCTEGSQPVRSTELLSREQQIRNLRSGEEYDVLIIGGGITGAGCALEAASRGLKTALVEYKDFASGTSSKSTKLIHGGVRYLVAAILELDYGQIEIVKECLTERKTMLKIAPHLSNPLQIMLPMYKYWQIPSYWILLKLYDFIAYSSNIHTSYFVTKSKALELFPMLNKDTLKGAVVFYEGQMDDARFNLAVALTATRYGATVCNYVEVKKLLKQTNSKGEVVLTGARVRDHIAGREFNIKAKCIINATGAFTDAIRKMDDSTIKPICSPSSGVHIILPSYYCPSNMGLLDPSTSDGRVLFFLPWKNHTLVGTTDIPTKPTHSPQPKESEVLFILSEIKKYFNSDVQVRRGDIQSAWCGLRPLITNPAVTESKKILRNHLIEISSSKLVTIAGGKYTTYRKMAQETIDAAILACNLSPKLEKSITQHIKLEGGLCWTPTLYIRIVQDFGLESDVAQHLAKSYGSKAFHIVKLATPTGKRWPILGNKIHPQLPYIEAEIRYGVREYACTATDMIARRLGISLLNVEATRESLPKIVNIMAEELKWSDKEKQKQLTNAFQFLDIEMGGQLNKLELGETIKTNLSNDELYSYVERFKTIDKDKKGFISINDIRRTMKCFGEDEISGEQMHHILSQVDVSMNGQVNLNEYLQMMSLLKTGKSAYEQNDILLSEIEKIKKNIEIERSGGGM